MLDRLSSMLVLSSAVAAALGVAAGAPLVDRPLLIAHRGVPFLIPAHTAAGYSAAAALLREGDVVEPDVVVSRDGVLFCHHSSLLDDSTDVASRPELLHRRVTKQVAGMFNASDPQNRVTGWFAEELTAAELRQLRVVQYTGSGYAHRARTLDGALSIPTLVEALTVIADRARRLSTPLRVEPELKNPGFLNAELARLGNGGGVRVEELLMDAFAVVGIAVRQGNVSTADGALMIGHVQCFEEASLAYLRRLYPHIPLLQLVKGFEDPPETRQPGLLFELRQADLVRVAAVADAIGVKKTAILPGALAAVGAAATAALPGVISGPPLVEAAHALGLAVHVFTFRDAREEDPRLLNLVADPAMRESLGAGPQGAHDADASVTALHAWAFDVGADGLFSEALTSAARARDEWVPRARAARSGGSDGDGRSLTVHLLLGGNSTANAGGGAGAAMAVVLALGSLLFGATAGAFVVWRAHPSRRR